MGDRNRMFVQLISFHFPYCSLDMKSGSSNLFSAQSPFSFKPSSGSTGFVGGASNVPATVTEEDEDKVPEPERKT